MKEQLEKLLKRSKAELEGDQSYLASMESCIEQRKTELKSVQKEVADQEAYRAEMKESISQLGGDIQVMEEKLAQAAQPAPEDIEKLNQSKAPKHQRRTPRLKSA